MRTLGRSLISCLLMALAAAGHAATPSVRVEVQGPQPVLVGQEVAIDITVVAPNFFTSAPPFPTLEVPGAVLTLPDERATLGVETVAGETYATVQRRYLFSAQQAGDFSLPPAKIDFIYMGDDGKPQQASLNLPATRLSARLPAGAAAGGAVLPVARLTIEQRFDRATDSLKAGDALVRTIEVTAARTQAMLIPPPTFEAPEGVRVFVADPVLRDESGRTGGFDGGRRVDRATYVFEQAGRYTLPAIELHWIDPVTQQPASAQAKALTVQVAAGSPGGTAIAPEGVPQVRVHWARWAGFVALALLAGGAAWLLRAYGPRWRGHWQARRRARRVSDRTMFDQLLAACEANDARAAHAAWLAWCARHAQLAPRTWAERFGGPELAAQLEALERHLYRAPAEAPWSGQALAVALRGAHRHWQRQALHRVGSHHRHGLEPLNPLETMKA